MARILENADPTSKRASLALRIKRLSALINSEEVKWIMTKVEAIKGADTQKLLETRDLPAEELVHLRRRIWLLNEVLDIVASEKRDVDRESKVAEAEEAKAANQPND